MFVGNNRWRVRWARLIVVEAIIGLVCTPSKVDYTSNTVQRSNTVKHTYFFPLVLPDVGQP